MSSLWWELPELVHQAEQFQLDIVSLTSTHSKGSGTSLLKRVSSSLEFPLVRDDRQGWQYLMTSGSVPVHWSFPNGWEGNLAPSSGGGHRSWWLLVSFALTVVRCIHPFRNPQREYERVRLLGFFSSFLVISMLMLAPTVRPGGAWLGRTAPDLFCCCWTTGLIRDCS